MPGILPSVPGWRFTPENEGVSTVKIVFTPENRWLHLSLRP
jgi:hypothetical protein